MLNRIVYFVALVVWLAAQLIELPYMKLKSVYKVTLRKIEINRLFLQYLNIMYGQGE